MAILKYLVSKAGRKFSIPTDKVFCPPLTPIIGFSADAVNQIKTN